MIINQEVTRLIHLVNTLLSKYEFTMPLEATSYTYIDIGYPLPSAHNEPRYVGTILLNRIHSYPFKPTDTVLGLPSYTSSFKEKLIKEWKSIGIGFEADKTNSDRNHYHYFRIWIEDDRN